MRHLQWIEELCMPAVAALGELPEQRLAAVYPAFEVSACHFGSGIGEV